MNNFAQTATKLLREYKNILKKQLTEAESAKQLADLHLNRRLPTRELTLYKLVHKIIDNADRFFDENNSHSRLRYSGISQFLLYMKSEMAFYQLDNNKVIHTTQSASKAMIDAIQLMSLPEARLSQDVYTKLDSCCSLIAHYGVKEQRIAFTNSLKSQLIRHINFFQPLFQSYQQYLQQAAQKSLPSADIQDIAC